MPRYYGRIGFVESQEYPPDSGIWQPVVTVKNYYGESKKRYSHRWSSQDATMDSVKISNSISIIADPFMRANLGDIRWVEWLGTKWKVTNIDVEFPRVELTLGDEYTVDDVEAT